MKCTTQYCGNDMKYIRYLVHLSRKCEVCGVDGKLCRVLGVGVSDLMMTGGWEIIWRHQSLCVTRQRNGDPLPSSHVTLCQEQDTGQHHPQSGDDGHCGWSHQHQEHPSSRLPSHREGCHFDLISRDDTRYFIAEQY